MSFIYFSYGITKSASSFVYQLEEEIIKSSDYNLAKLPEEISENRAKENYLEKITDEKINTILEWLPENSVTVIKTHSAPSRLALKLINEGKAFASITYRDPRDIVVSILDHGKKSREKGVHGFARYHHTLDTIDMLVDQIDNRFSLWKECDNSLLLNYDLIKNSPNIVVDKIIKQIKVTNVEISDVLEKFDDRSNVIHYNVGKNERFLDLMTKDEIKTFNHIFKDFIDFCN